ncbi:MAG: ketoacyl-ACP synthase III [Desulfobacterales bacterium]|nr:ketoacyl-ACP synthase III [Desulfobacterales bacterium]
MFHSHIIGTGSAIPKRILSNKELESLINTSDEWIVRRTGIKTRHICSKDENESSTDLALQASLKAIEMAGISADKLDMIVMGTVTPDYQFPSTGCMVQNALKANKAAAFDVSAGCSGFLYALSMVDNAIRSGNCKTALVAGVERLSSIINWQDRSTCVLLADGAGAVVVNATEENRGILSTHIRSDGKYWDLLYSSYVYGKSYRPELLESIDMKPFYLKMEGNRLFKKAIRCLSLIAQEAMETNSICSEDISLVIPHQANIRIIEGLANNLNIPMEKVYINIQKYGNTSSASIPIALDEANREGRLKKGDYVLIVSFGAGLTWASSIFQWSI